MGEVLVSSEGRMQEEMPVNETEIGIEVDTETKNNNNKEDVRASPGVVRWEKFLPRMVLRVLLVETDDSTRQIVTALLRKCNYKVAAVSDGLKAWELLKGRPHNIDLILTEVELPSISGVALLTLITEHENCKSIPVIMMSAHDSVSTVYKCMLRGATDFLVKPLRKNELKNLWQHVWRRQASNSCGPQDASDAQQKVEATAENNATSNHSSGYIACIQRNRECIEKGSDAQSSCTKPDLAAEGAYMKHRQDLSQVKPKKSQSSDMKIQNPKESGKGNEKMSTHNSEAEGSPMVADMNASRTTLGREMAIDSQREHADVNTEASDNNHVRISSLREAIDLIGTFDNDSKCNYRNLGSNYGTNNIDSSSQLDLSLRRSHPSGSVNQVMDESHRLKHSDASAFSRYVSRTIPTLHSTSASVSHQQKGYETNSDKRLSHQALDYNSDTHCPTRSHDNNMISLTSSQPAQAEIQFPSPPVPVPVRSIRLKSLYPAYGSIMPPIFSLQPSLSPLLSPGYSGYQDLSFQYNQNFPSNPEIRNSQQLHYLMEKNNYNALGQMEPKKGHELDPLEDRGHFSSATDQSGSSSFCNGNLSRLNSINSGSNGNTNPVPIVKASAECGNEATIIHDGNCLRSAQREAALTKFRMKRKDRCYEKKVRYESRKKLAEQRPRVKGQFVRQVNIEAPSIETDDQRVDSSAN